MCGARPNAETTSICPHSSPTSIRNRDIFAFSCTTRKIATSRPQQAAYCALPPAAMLLALPPGYVGHGTTSERPEPARARRAHGCGNHDFHQAVQDGARRWSEVDFLSARKRASFARALFGGHRGVVLSKSGFDTSMGTLFFAHPLLRGGLSLAEMCRKNREVSHGARGVSENVGRHQRKCPCRRAGFSGIRLRSWTTLVQTPAVCEL